MRKHLIVMGLFFGCALQGAYAHGFSLSDLQGLPLCIDASSVTVAIEDAELPGGYESAIKKRLAAALIATLEHHKIPYRSLASCSGEQAYVTTRFEASLDPSQDGADEAEPYLAYAALTWVKPYEPYEPEEAEVADAPLFELTDSWAYRTSDLSGPYYEVLPKINEAMFVDLASAWWNDYAYEKERQVDAERRLLVRLALLSVTFSGLLVTGAFRVRGRSGYRRMRREAS